MAVTIIVTAIGKRDGHACGSIPQAKKDSVFTPPKGGPSSHNINEFNKIFFQVLLAICDGDSQVPLNVFVLFFQACLVIGPNVNGPKFDAIPVVERQI